MSAVAELPADLRAGEPVLTKCAEEIERNRCQQDLGILKGECSLQNCIRCWRSCFHTVVDVANQSGVTSDESGENGIDSLCFIKIRIRKRSVQTSDEKMCEM